MFIGLLVIGVPLIFGLAYGAPGSGETSYPAFSLSSSGFLSGKVAPTTGDLLAEQGTLHNHGALYADIIPALLISDEATARIRLNLQNASFSEFETETAKWYFSGRLERHFGPGTAAGQPGYWRLEAGNLDPQTVGEGLTFKDFETLGVSGLAAWKGIEAELTTWAQDYDEPGDVFLGRIAFAPSHAGVNFILWFDEQTISGGPSVYVLPYVALPMGPCEAYAEGGAKIPGREDRNFDNPHSVPDRTWAALLGARYATERRGWRLRLNPEVRFYGRGFIPLTDARPEVYTGLYNYTKSADNWEDFFSSVESNRWIYLKSSLETPRWAGLSVFFDNEWLAYFSSQDLFWERSSQAVVAYHPSSDYYWLGARYSAPGGIRLELLATNRMINIDPAVNRDPGSDLPLMQSGPRVMRQFRMRFYPAEYPVMELRALWGLGAI